MTYSRVLAIAIVLGACGGGAGAQQTTAPVAEPMPLPPVVPDSLRKHGYPTDADCHAAIDHMLRLVRAHEESAQQMAAYGGETAVREEAFHECRRQWLLANTDCMLAATQLSDVEPCTSRDIALPPVDDPGKAPNRPTHSQCTTAIANLESLQPTRYDDAVRLTLVQGCVDGWRPHVLACVAGATSAQAAEDCHGTMP